jgi:hypothetical protein
MEGDGHTCGHLSWDSQDAYFSRRLESAKHGGAQSPTKIPNRSP